MPNSLPLRRESLNGPVSAESLSHGVHARVGVVTRDKIKCDLGASVVLLFFVAGIQKCRAVTYLVNCALSFSGAKFFAASTREFEWSKFQPCTCSDC